MVLKSGPGMESQQVKGEISVLGQAGHFGQSCGHIFPPAPEILLSQADRVTNIELLGSYMGFLT